jgi:probable F420-dependent oxidoreductase
MSLKERFGRVGIWEANLDDVPVPQALEAVQLIEELGFPALWVAEAVGRDPFIMATNYLHATSQLHVATGIANIYARDAMAMNSSARTLESSFPDRFLLGLGVSHSHLVKDRRNHDYSKPLSYMSAYLDQMDTALFLAEGPTEQPPRILGALGPKMLELASTKALGSHPYLTTTDHTASARKIMGPDALLMPEQMVVLETDPVIARTIARKHVGGYLTAPNYFNTLFRLGFDETDLKDGGSDRLIDGLVAWGSLDDIAKRVTEHHDNGADHVCLQVLRDDYGVPTQQWRELASALL